jgi:hypothetical protein
MDITKRINFLSIGLIAISIIGIFMSYTLNITGNAVQEIKISTFNSSYDSDNIDFISFEKIERQENSLNVEYNFNTEKFIGDGTAVDIWISDSEGNEIRRFQDGFLFDKQGIIKRKAVLQLPENIIGAYYVYAALSSDLSNYARQTVIIGKSLSTGHTILDEPKNKMIGYGVFIIIIIIGIYFIARNYWKDENYSDDSISNKKRRKA